MKTIQQVILMVIFFGISTFSFAQNTDTRGEK
ncbi:MAG: hypothetical protein ACD_46C00438G0002 [uncultured bacterium]|nr:MAG: hypothetical protein ACD_46C00438G0002 [uncultured bacterium]